MTVDVCFRHVSAARLKAEAAKIRARRQEALGEPDGAVPLGVADGQVVACPPLSPTYGYVGCA